MRKTLAFRPAAQFDSDTRLGLGGFPAALPGAESLGRDARLVQATAENVQRVPRRARRLDRPRGDSDTSATVGSYKQRAQMAHGHIVI